MVVNANVAGLYHCYGLLTNAITAAAVAKFLSTGYRFVVQSQEILTLTSYV
jgi:hypothetical protein